MSRGFPSTAAADVEISPPNLLTWGEQSYILPLLRGYGFARNFGGTKPGWSLVDRSGFCFGGCYGLRAAGCGLRANSTSLLVCISGSVCSNRQLAALPRHLTSLSESR